MILSCLVVYLLSFTIPVKIKIITVYLLLAHPVTTLIGKQSDCRGSYEILNVLGEVDGERTARAGGKILN